MCKEYTTIAICAPQKAPSMSFTCGQLHQVVDRRQVCDKATGSCICFVGTCGTLETVPSTLSIPIASLKSIRCVACTAREEEIGDRRSNEELIDSPLLTRAAVKSPEDMQHFKEIIKSLWNGEEECPYHTMMATREKTSDTPIITKHASDVDIGKDADIDISIEVHTAGLQEDIDDGNISEASSNATHGSNGSLTSNLSQQSNKKKDNSGLGRKVGLQASIWANAPAKTPERKKHIGSPKSRSPVKRQKPVAPQGQKPVAPQGQKPVVPQEQKPAVAQAKKTKMNLPQIAAAKSFLKAAIVQN
ncbi:hypothetical protein M431DRAFT_509601 [Trichoderma harzianum CBS 226.95]|uniref:Uncharacterized protein n=1 Tax=Trichoderma harzianum CBS 226.95 TaxID=983964 RepID=A0A2T4A8D9_TRIHA|nr:hypothetical protein M431DRAFT_509601 [Trichoderma harzianum CBS 226.95]PTB53312.1 hypothetical protein M431DRAFT_509601 [Trichoderma harzianum CBS 226.95]